MTANAAEKLAQITDEATRNWVPKWFAAFSDNRHGGFHERLGPDGQPLDMPKRLLTQCRQIIVYSQASQLEGGEKYLPKLKEAFEFVLDHYRVPETGGSIFSITPEGKPHDLNYDLYGQAFVLLGCAAYYNATKDQRALDYASETLDFVNHYRIDGEPGLVSALDKKLNPIAGMRLQNPHMHLVEGCVYMAEASGDQKYLDFASEMIDLFQSRLLDAKTATLGEFFDEQLRPHAEKGEHVEAGHHSEWVWLLQRYQDVSNKEDPKLQGTMARLFTWVASKGFDKEFGGIYNAQTRAGDAIDTNKRIWPNLETVRAASIMSNVPGFEEQSEKIINDLMGVLRTKYFKADGFWNEILKRDLTPDTNYNPGTTPYHIYPVLRESAGYVAKAKPAIA